MFRWLKGRVTSTANTVAQVARDPKSAPLLMRRAFVRLWKARGGGVYGFGYVVAFIVFQVQSLAGEVEGATSVEAFVATQVTNHLLRFGIDSMVNVFKALLWPAFVVGLLGGAGIVLLLAAFYGFERWLRPVVERAVPELARESVPPTQSVAGRDGSDDQGAH